MLPSFRFQRTRKVQGFTRSSDSWCLVVLVVSSDSQYSQQSFHDPAARHCEKNLLLGRQPSARIPGTARIKRARGLPIQSARKMRALPGAQGGVISVAI